MVLLVALTEARGGWMAVARLIAVLPTPCQGAFLLSACEDCPVLGSSRLGMAQHFALPTAQHPRAPRVPSLPWVSTPLATCCR